LPPIVIGLLVEFILLLPVGVQTGGRLEGKRKPWKQEFEVEKWHGYFSVYHLHYFDHWHRDYPPPDEVYPEYKSRIR